MRIEAVELTEIALPLKETFETSFGAMNRRRLLLIKVFLKGGAYGWGEVSALNDPLYSYETPETAWYVLTKYLVPAVLDVEITHPSRISSCYETIRGHNFAKAGLENAVWDAYARMKGLPLAKVLGGTRERVEVGVSIGIQKSPGDLVKEVERFVVQGYKRIKIKIGPGRDIDYLRAVRRVFPDLPMMADANSAYTLDNIRIFRELDALNLMMLEQPLAWDDIVDHAKLQATLTTAICLDESIHSPEDARKAIELGACRVINIKVGRVGGHQAALEIHNLAWSKGLPVWCGGMLESGVGRAHNIHMATLPGYTLPGDTSAFDRYYHEDIVDEPAVLNRDGTLTVPMKPGIGVDVVPSALKRCTVRSQLIKK